MGGERDASAEHFAAIESLGEMSGALQGTSRKQQLQLMRDYMDAMGDGVEFDGEIIRLGPLQIAGATVSGEWIVPPGADESKRLLYIHGGAWIAGSPASHRAITTKYARLLGGAVFSLDYRLMPEHSRQAGIDDCRAAYTWILDNGPRGESAPRELFVSGDSAGGNLSLSLSAWIRDEGLRPPNGVIALSPATDGTLASPSMKANVSTDHMLGPMFGKMAKVPKFLLRIMGLFSNRIRPNHPMVSPVYGDLSGLPPTLVHASAHEMLLDDAVRYANKASVQGSPVELQVWNDMLHVWHIFVRDDLPEALEAFTEIDRFLQANGSAGRAVGEAA